MVKWHKIHDNWEYKKLKFWSICNWFHRFNYWYKDLYVEKGTLCRKCKVWWDNCSKLKLLNK